MLYQTMKAKYMVILIFDICKAKITFIAMHVYFATMLHIFSCVTTIDSLLRDTQREICENDVNSSDVNSSDVKSSVKYFLID